MQPFRAVLLAAIVFSATPLAAQDLPPPARRSILTVGGEGIATGVPDIANFSTGVVSAAKTAREALDANTKAVSDVVAAIKGVGVEPRDISTSGFSVQPQYANVKRDSNEAPRIAGYEVRNTVSVRLRDLTKLGGLLDEVVTKGANQIGGISFDVAEPAKLEEQARIAAVKDARHQAEIMADAAGVRLVRIISVAEDGARPVPMPRMMVAAAPMAKRDSVPMEAGESEVRAHVTIIYEIEPR